MSRSTQTDDIMFGAHLGVLREYENPNMWTSAGLLNATPDHLTCLGSISTEDASSRQPLVLRERERMQLCPQPNNSSNGSTSTDKNSLLTLSSSGSIQSAPLCRPAVKTVTGETFNRSRRWTFVETGKTPRGAPRGLVIPCMFTSQRSKQVHTTDVKRLIAEIDVRLEDCRSLAAPGDSSSSTAGGTAHL